jgi:hypothetical protein
MQNRKEKIPVGTINVDLTLRRLCTVSGKRLFLTPNLMNRSSFVPEKLDTRKKNIVIDLGYVDTDTIAFHLPESIYPEFTPESVRYTSRFTFEN